MRNKRNIGVRVTDVLALGLVIVYDSLPLLVLISLIFVPLFIR